MDFDFKKRRFALSVVSAGFIYFLATTVLGSVTQMIFPYDILTLGGMRVFDDPVMFWFFFSGIVIMLAPSFIYPMLKMKGSVLKEGLFFGSLMWLAYSLPSAFVVFTSMNYPIGFTFDSLVVTYIAWILSGIVIAKIHKN